LNSILYVHVRVKETALDKSNTVTVPLLPPMTTVILFISSLSPRKCSGSQRRGKRVPWGRRNEIQPEDSFHSKELLDEGDREAFGYKTAECKAADLLAEIAQSE
jgi:hypothetical protein